MNQWPDLKFFKCELVKILQIHHEMLREREDPSRVGTKALKRIYNIFILKTTLS